ncbi:30S ribosomal protein S27ae [Candidatus Woesearchaeota archaeon]|nr:30S ribosomal protein S27ae [Candidatus Woesearchaeota archaeon]MBU3941798.1 30S ribosomal protein S27ae [Nanoarchaeota archaeon]
MAKNKKKPQKAVDIKSLYSVEGGVLKRKTKFCPKCGPGVFLAIHKNRVSCGKCGYTEFTKKSEQK